LWEDLSTPSVPLQPEVVNQTISVFGNPGMYLPRTDYWNVLRWTGFYDTSPLVKTLDRHVDFARLGPQNFAMEPQARAPRLILTATNVVSGQLERFDSKEMQITPSHVRASGSLPPSFPPTTAAVPTLAGEAEHLYWDGGLFDNTPLSKVIDALQESEDADRSMYVVNLFPPAAPAPENMPEVLVRMMTLAFSNRMAKDLQRAGQTTELIRFVAELDKLMEKHPDLRRLAEHPGYKTVKRFKAPIHIVEVTNRDVRGAAAFSRAGIEQRRRAGYQAARSAMGPSQLAA
jgi:predicted acylesterase/phospholipase RssA